MEAAAASVMQVCPGPGAPAVQQPAAGRSGNSGEISELGTVGAAVAAVLLALPAAPPAATAPAAAQARAPVQGKGKRKAEQQLHPAPEVRKRLREVEKAELEQLLQMLFPPGQGHTRSGRLVKAVVEPTREALLSGWAASRGMSDEALRYMWALWQAHKAGNVQASCHLLNSLRLVDAWRASGARKQELPEALVRLGRPPGWQPPPLSTGGVETAAEEA